MGLNLSDAEMNDFIKNRILYKKIILAATNFRRTKEENTATELNVKEQKCYELITSDLNNINNFLKNFNLIPAVNSQNINGYRIDWHGFSDFSLVAHIRKNDTDMEGGFFWTISVIDPHNNGKYLYGHINTNGSIVDLTEAFNHINTNQDKQLVCKRNRCTIS